VSRPVLHQPALEREVGAQLRRLWEEGAISRGQVVEIDGRRFRIQGFDPVSVRPRRLYVEDLGGNASFAFEVEEEAR
jgi:hypothetical protein